MNQSLSVLIVDDSEDDMALVVRALRRTGYALDYVRVDTAAAMKEALAKGSWDAIICDYHMPRFGGLEALALMQADNYDLPFVIVSGTVGEELAVQAMKAGAHDYVMKANLTRLAPVLEREIREAQVRKERAAAEAARREIDQRNRAILNTAAEGIITFDARGRIELFNPAAETIFGYTADEIIGENLALLLPTPNSKPDDPLSDLEPIRPVGDARQVYNAMGCRKDGSTMPLEISVSEIVLERGKLFTGIVRDITERKQAQDQIRKQFERLTALRAIDVAIMGSLDIQVTLSIVLDQVTTLLHVDAADILLVAPSTQTLECASARGFHNAAIMRTRLRLGEGHTGRAALEERMVNIPDLREAEEQFDRPDLIRDQEFVSYSSVPLVAKGQLRGVLETFHRSPLYVDEEWLEYLRTLAGQAAIAIENNALFRDLQRSNVELALAYDATIEGWSRALDLRDKETEGHTRRVADLTLKLAKAMGMNESEVAQVWRGALLHDVGKLGVPDSILLKPGPLTEEEWVVMRRHPAYAYEWLSPIAFLRPALDIPYCHHEKWDGTGYPRGLKGEQIPRAARMFAVVDVWDALCSGRPYRASWPVERVTGHIQNLAGTHFDPQIVKTFLEMMEASSGMAQPIQSAKAA